MSKFSREIPENMIKLFEFYSGPAETEDKLSFQIIPTDELEENMDAEWLDKLGEDLCQLFIEYANRAADNEDAFEDFDILKIIGKIDREGFVSTDYTALEILDNLIDQMDEEQFEVFEKIQKSFSKIITNEIREFFIAVNGLVNK